MLSRETFQGERQSGDQTLIEKEPEEPKPKKKMKAEEDLKYLPGDVPLQEIGLAKILMNKPAPHVSA